MANTTGKITRDVFSFKGKRNILKSGYKLLLCVSPGVQSYLTPGVGGSLVSIELK